MTGSSAIVRNAAPSGDGVVDSGTLEGAIRGGNIRNDRPNDCVGA
jgi:hypothetical protein